MERLIWGDDMFKVTKSKRFPVRDIKCLFDMRNKKSCIEEKTI